MVLLNADLSPVLGQPGQTGEQQGQQQTGTIVAQNVPPAEQPAAGGMNILMMVAVWGLVLGGFYFLTIRPQRKRDKQMREMQAAIKVGDNVITSGGLYGKVADLGEDCFVVEFGTNRGTRIPIRKTDVLGIKTPQLTPLPADRAEKPEES
ncbi:MAG: preprotein translocase subunit YajC [Turicibacter sp.]|nr:preprotein translocase subunit YajC [Turicibacter sp.]